MTCICGRTNCLQADCEHCSLPQCEACWNAAAEADAEADADPTYFLSGLKRLLRHAIVGEASYKALAARPVNWVWQDYAVGGTIIVIAGPPGGGKTTLLFLLLLARAASRPIELLNRTVQPAPRGQYVVLIEGEHGEPSTARKLIKSAALLGPQAEGALDRVVTIARKAVTLGSPEWLEIEELIERGLVSDIAIDTLARVAPGESNSEEAQAAIFDIVAKAIEKAPKAPPTAWLLAHTRKGDVAALDDVSGSTQRVAQADAVILVKPKRDSATGQVVESEIKLLKAREEPDAYPDNATLSIKDENLSFDSTSNSYGEQKASSVLGEQIIELLVERERPCSTNYISEKLGRSWGDIKAELESLGADNRVELIDNKWCLT